MMNQVFGFFKKEISIQKKDLTPENAKIKWISINCWEVPDIIAACNVSSTRCKLSSDAWRHVKVAS